MELAHKLQHSIDILLTQYCANYDNDLCVIAPIELASAGDCSKEAYDVYQRSVYGIYPDNRQTDDCIARKILIAEAAYSRCDFFDVEAKNYFAKKHILLSEIKCFLDEFYAKNY